MDGRVYSNFDWRSPFKSYFWVARDIIVEPERFFRAVRGSGYGGPTLLVVAGHLIFSLLTALYVLPFVLLPAVSIISQEGYEPQVFTTA